MNKLTVPVLAAAAVLGLAGAAMPARAASLPAAETAVITATAPISAPAPGSDVARGEYLVKIMVCNDCHTPFTMGPEGPEPDMSRMLSGHPQDFPMPPAPAGAGPWIWSGAATNTAFAGPWGVSFTANLTPDDETGLGKWTEDMFVQTIRTGHHQGVGRPILPPMPWPFYRFASDEDLDAIYSYLRTIPAIRNRVPQPIDPPESR